ncbi:unnamed protein product, partial [Durusdinium trenchii]
EDSAGEQRRRDALSLDLPNGAKVEMTKCTSKGAKFSVAGTPARPTRKALYFACWPAQWIGAVAARQQPEAKTRLSWKAQRVGDLTLGTLRIKGPLAWTNRIETSPRSFCRLPWGRSHRRVFLLQQAVARFAEDLCQRLDALVGQDDENTNSMADFPEAIAVTAPDVASPLPSDQLQHLRFLLEKRVILPSEFDALAGRIQGSVPTAAPLTVT